MKMAKTNVFLGRSQVVISSAGWWFSTEHDVQSIARRLPFPSYSIILNPPRTCGFVLDLFNLFLFKSLYLLTALVLGLSKIYRKNGSPQQFFGGSLCPKGIKEPPNLVDNNTYPPVSSNTACWKIHEFTKIIKAIKAIHDLFIDGSPLPGLHLWMAFSIDFHCQVHRVTALQPSCVLVPGTKSSKTERKLCLDVLGLWANKMVVQHGVTLLLGLL